MSNIYKNTPVDLPTLALAVGVLQGNNMFSNKQTEVFLHRFLALKKFGNNHHELEMTIINRLGETLILFDSIHPNINLDVVNETDKLK